MRVCVCSVPPRHHIFSNRKTTRIAVGTVQYARYPPSHTITHTRARARSAPCASPCASVAHFAQNFVSVVRNFASWACTRAPSSGSALSYSAALPERLLRFEIFIPTLLICMNFFFRKLVVSACVEKVKSAAETSERRTSSCAQSLTR